METIEELKTNVHTLKEKVDYFEASIKNTEDIYNVYKNFKLSF